MVVLEQTQPQGILSHIVYILIPTELYRRLFLYLCAQSWTRIPVPVEPC
jgi:hypothetical protein